MLKAKQVQDDQLLSESGGIEGDRFEVPPWWPRQLGVNPRGTDDATVDVSRILVGALHTKLNHFVGKKKLPTFPWVGTLTVFESRQIRCKRFDIEVLVGEGDTFDLHFLGSPSCLVLPSLLTFGCLRNS